MSLEGDSCLTGDEPSRRAVAQSGMSLRVPQMLVLLFSSGGFPPRNIKIKVSE